MQATETQLAKPRGRNAAVVLDLDRIKLIDELTVVAPIDDLNERLRHPEYLPENNSQQKWVADLGH